MKMAEAVNIGLDAQARKAVAEALAGALADTHALALKTQNFHWNVAGPHFYALHGMFEGQYTELNAAVDEIAERIRALGHPAPGGYQAFAKLTAVADASGVPAAAAMVQALAADHETVVKRLRAALKTAQNAGDEESADLLIERLQAHEKTAWMLRASAA
jgi:starvation-inducible DNA-binding protein